MQANKKAVLLFNKISLCLGMVNNGFCADTQPAAVAEGGGSPYGSLCDIGLNLLDGMFFG